MVKSEKLVRHIRPDYSRLDIFHMQTELFPSFSKNHVLSLILITLHLASKFHTEINNF